jgi:Uncharacterized phage-associated protein
MITARTVAQFFLAFANDCQELITNLKLNKLVYYAQAWHLALFNEPLFDDQIEAWVHGPVVPVLYSEYRGYRYRPILDNDLDLGEIKQNFSSRQQELLDDIIEIYFPKTAYELEQLTHSEDPWIHARKGLAPDALSQNIISPESMQRYYATKLEQDGQE